MATPAKATPKTAKKTRIVTLHLSPDTLARFSPNSSRTSTSTAVPPKQQDPTPSIVQPAPSSADKSSESNATPNPSGANDTPDPSSLAPPPKVDGRRKRGGGAVAGRKRAPPIIDPNAPPRERGRPGPKKKPRLADGTIDRNTDKPVASTVPAHKLGPKANTGAINAGLRALDRTGKPCRRWEKKGMQLKSFTGTSWNMSSWKAPTRSNGLNADGETKSDSSSEVKPPNSSAVVSERSQSGAEPNDTTMNDTTMMNGLQSSPAPQTAEAS